MASEKASRTTILFERISYGFVLMLKDERCREIERSDRHLSRNAPALAAPFTQRSGKGSGAPHA